MRNEEERLNNIEKDSALQSQIITYMQKKIDEIDVKLDKILNKFENIVENINFRLENIVKDTNNKFDNLKKEFAGKWVEIAITRTIYKIIFYIITGILWLLFLSIKLNII